MRKDRKLDDLGEKTSSGEHRGGEYIKTCTAQRRDPACVFKRLRLASEALRLRCWFRCPATELVLNIYYAPTADTLRSRHALEIDFSARRAVQESQCCTEAVLEARDHGLTSYLSTFLSFLCCFVNLKEKYDLLCVKACS